MLLSMYFAGCSIEYLTPAWAAKWKIKSILLFLKISLIFFFLLNLLYKI